MYIHTFFKASKVDNKAVQGTRPNISSLASSLRGPARGLGEPEHLRAGRTGRHGAPLLGPAGVGGAHDLASS